MLHQSVEPKEIQLHFFSSDASNHATLFGAFTPPAECSVICIIAQDNFVPSLPSGFRYFFISAIASDHTAYPSVLIACPVNLPDKMLSFASNIKKVFVEFCSEDQWKLLQGESPEVEEKEKLKRIEGDSDGESNEICL